MSRPAGLTIVPWEAEVRGEKMKIFAALIRDPNPIHFDPRVVAALGLGDRAINQGPINMAYIMNAISAWSGGNGVLRTFACRFAANVVADDRVVVDGRVNETGVVANGEEIVKLDVWLDVVGGDRALEGSAEIALPLT